MYLRVWMAEWEGYNTGSRTGTLKSRGGNHDPFCRPTMKTAWRHDRQELQRLPGSSGTFMWWRLTQRIKGQARTISATKNKYGYTLQHGNSKNMMLRERNQTQGSLIAWLHLYGMARTSKSTGTKSRLVVAKAGEKWRVLVGTGFLWGMMRMCSGIKHGDDGYTTLWICSLMLNMNNTLNFYKGKRSKHTSSSLAHETSENRLFT